MGWRENQLTPRDREVHSDDRRQYVLFVLQTISAQRRGVVGCLQFLCYYLPRSVRMPLLHKQPFVPEAPPSDLQPDEEVFVCQATREVFRDYE